MSERIGELIPIDKLNSQSNRLKVTVVFPRSVNPSLIGVDLEKAEKLMQLGGIRNATLGVERSKNYPVISGVNSNNTLYASRAITSTEEPTFELKTPDNEWLLRNTSWADANINVNWESFNESTKNTGKCIRFLDNSLRSGLRKAGTKHLLFNQKDSEKITAVVFNAALAMMSAAGISPQDIVLGSANSHPPTAGEAAFQTIYTAAFLSLGLALIAGSEKKSRGYRISIFPGFEVDRAAYLQFVSRTQKVVKEINNIIY